MAVESGDRRWSRLARGDESSESWRTGKGPSDLRLEGRASLTFTLRARFGPGARADILSFLVGSADTRATVREIAEATGYTATSLRTALNDMERARFVDATRTHPARYSASEGWQDLLGTDSSEKTWRNWAGIFRFIWDALAALEPVSPGTDRYLVATSLRDVFERHAATFERNRIPLDRGESARGAKFLEAFARTLRTVAAWADRNV